MTQDYYDLDGKFQLLALMQALPLVCLLYENNQISLLRTGIVSD